MDKDKEKRLLESRLAERRVTLARKYSEGVIKEMAYGNQELLDFFKKLDEYVDIIVEEIIEENSKHIDECAKMIGRSMPQKDKIEARLKEMGVELTFYFQYPLSMGQFRHKDRTRDSFIVYQEFNGHKLTKEMLLDEKNEEIRKRYENAKRNNANTDAEIQSLKKEISELERKKKHALFEKKRIEYADILEEDNERLLFLETAKRDEETLRKTLEALDAITPEQRREFLRYFEVTEPMIELTKVIDSYKRLISAVKPEKYNKETVPAAFDRLVAEHGVKPETVLKLFTMLGKVEAKTNAGSYSSKVVSKKEVAIEKYKDVVEGALKFIYEPEKPIEKQEFLIKRGYVTQTQKAEPEEPEGDEKV